MADHNLDEVAEEMSQEMFGWSRKDLNKLQASGLIQRILEEHSIQRSVGGRTSEQKGEFRFPKSGSNGIWAEKAPSCSGEAFFAAKATEKTLSAEVTCRQMVFSSLMTYHRFFRLLGEPKLHPNGDSLAAGFVSGICCARGRAARFARVYGAVIRNPRHCCRLLA